MREPAQCIICREKNMEMTDEHVIPDSLGGFYHIFSVCKDCNSEMGIKVDSPLVNHKLSEFYRFREELEGKSGKIPNPFVGTFVDENDSDVKARVESDDEGKLKVVYLPVVKIQEENGLVKSIEIKVDSGEEEKIEGIFEKILRRKKIPSSAVVKNERRREGKRESVSGTWEIDILKFKIGLLKIAYEFAVDSIGSYFNDPDAVKIAKILKNAEYDGVEEYVSIGSGLQHEIFDGYANYLDLESKKTLSRTNSNQGRVGLLY